MRFVNDLVRMRSSIFILILVLASCSSVPEEKTFEFFLDESCMITNIEQTNLIEGTHLRVSSVDSINAILTIDLPKNFKVNSVNCLNWTLGWSTGKPYYDAGVENIREIRAIDVNSGKITLGLARRGHGFPRKGQRVVFWNANPSGYKKVTNAPVIHPDFWPEFHGQSIGFSSIVYDRYRQIWITLVNEIDSDKIQTYAAISTDLVHWRAANKGKPVLTGNDFKECSWVTKGQTPIISEIIQHDGNYYLFMDSKDAFGKRHIGLATAEDLLGEYTIYVDPILSPKENSWCKQGVFCAKVAERKGDFLLFFDGRNADGYEQIGRATSKDLISWKMDAEPVLDQHLGWRSATFTSEPNYVETHGDTVLLMAAGAKKFQEGLWHQHITHRAYHDLSGNVNDAQLGAFISFDGGKTFHPHSNNPIFTNAYSIPFENEHMGGNIERIEKDSVSYLFYQAKSSLGEMKYSIFLRTKPTNR